MNIFKIIISFLGFILLIFIYIAYQQGIKKTIKRLLSFLIPILLSGFAIQISNILLTNYNIISYYIAIIGTILFYIVLKPTIMKEKPDRYKKINKQSQILACFIAPLQVWIISAFILFVINLVYPKPLTEIKPLIDFLTIPIKLLWFFPQ